MDGNGANVSRRGGPEGDGRAAGLSADRTAEGWDGASEIYDLNITRVTRPHAEEALRLAGIKPGDRVLDIASGPGTASLIAAKMGASVLATDFAPAMIERLRRHIEREGITGIETAVMDGQQLDLPDGSFDVACSIFGLIFFPDRMRGFREMHRVLKTGGRAVVTSWSTPDKVEPLTIWGAMVRAVAPDLPRQSSPPAVFSLSDPGVFRSEMEEAGFRNVRITPAVRDWEAASPDAFWDDLWQSSPVIVSTLARLTRDQCGAVREALVGSLRERFGDGPVAMPGEALIGAGTR